MIKNIEDYDASLCTESYRKYGLPCPPNKDGTVQWLKHVVPANKGIVFLQTTPHVLPCLPFDKVASPHKLVLTVTAYVKLLGFFCSATSLTGKVDSEWIRMTKKMKLQLEAMKNNTTAIDIVPFLSFVSHGSSHLQKVIESYAEWKLVLEAYGESQWTSDQPLQVTLRYVPTNKTVAQLASVATNHYIQLDAQLMGQIVNDTLMYQLKKMFNLGGYFTALTASPPPTPTALALPRYPLSSTSTTSTTTHTTHTTPTQQQPQPQPKPPMDILERATREILAVTPPPLPLPPLPTTASPLPPLPSSSSSHPPTHKGSKRSAAHMDALYSDLFGDEPLPSDISSSSEAEKEDEEEDQDTLANYTMPIIVNSTTTTNYRHNSSSPPKANPNRFPSPFNGQGNPLHLPMLPNSPLPIRSLSPTQMAKAAAAAAATTTSKSSKSKSHHSSSRSKNSRTKDHSNNSSRHKSRSKPYDK